MGCCWLLYSAALCPVVSSGSLLKIFLDEEAMNQTQNVCFVCDIWPLTVLLKAIFLVKLRRRKKEKKGLGGGNEGNIYILMMSSCSLRLCWGAGVDNRALVHHAQALLCQHCHVLCVCSLQPAMAYSYSDWNWVHKCRVVQWTSVLYMSVMCECGI